jgi:hypothetical protein
MTTPRRAGAPPRRPDPNRAARLQRDAGLERSRSLTKGIAFGSVAAVAVAGVYLSQSLPGHAATPSASTSSGAAAGSGAASSNSGGSSGYEAPTGGGVSAPAQAPVQAPVQQAPVVSGSS